MKGWQFIKQNKKSGVSMVLVLCVSAFFVAFAAAMVYAAGMVTAQSNQRLKEERCYQLAKSYGKVLTKELTKYQKKYQDDGKVAENGTFYAFANNFLDNSQYLEYNSDYSTSTTYNFVLSDANLADLFQSPMPDASYGNISIALRKETNSSEDIGEIMKGGSIVVEGSGMNYSDKITSIENTTVRQYNMILDITAYYDNVSYTYNLEFAREEQYPVSFKYKDQAVVWDSISRTWKYGNTAGEECVMTAGDTITYEYITTSATMSKFTENRLEGGGTSDE